MVRRKKKEPQPEHTREDASEPPAPQVVGGTETARPAANEPPTPPEGEAPAGPKPESKLRQAAEKLRSVLGRYFPGKKVELIDDGNARGLGIKLTYDDPAERPSDAVKQIIRSGGDTAPGFRFAGAIKQWRKRIGAQAAPKAAVAIRLDAERRVEAVGDQMMHEERLKAERERGGAGERTPS